MSNCSRRRRRWAPRHSQMMCAPSHAVRGIERARGAAITWAEHHISRARVQLPPGDRKALSPKQQKVAGVARRRLTFGDSAFLSHEAAIASVFQGASIGGGARVELERVCHYLDQRSDSCAALRCAKSSENAPKAPRAPDTSAPCEQQLATRAASKRRREKQNDRLRVHRRR